MRLLATSGSSAASQWLARIEESGSDDGVMLEGSEKPGKSASAAISTSGSPEVAEKLRAKGFKGGIVGYSAAFELEEYFLPYGPAGQNADLFLLKGSVGAVEMREAILKAYEASLSRKAAKS